MKSHVTEPLRPRREHVWVRLQREPESGDYAAALDGAAADRVHRRHRRGARSGAVVSRTDVSTHTRNISRDPRISETIKKGDYLRSLVAADANPTHRYAKRAWGQGCRECGQSTKADVHRVHPRPAGTTSVARACLDCAGPLSPRALRCKPCNAKRINAAATRVTQLRQLKLDAHRRGENA